MPTLAELMPSLAKVRSRAEPSTERQQAAVRAIGFVGDPSGLTLGQASALISAKVYAEGAMYVLIKRTDGYPHEQLAEANLAAFIVTDDKLRARAMEWNERRYARGYRGIPKPKQDEHLERVMDEADRLYKILLPYDF
jgi:hypothetical protein